MANGTFFIPGTNTPFNAQTQTVAIVPQGRSIGGITAQVTIRESYRNDLTITEHPVENGANIADHAFVRPREIELEIAWDGTHNPADVFYQIKYLQSSRLPFTIYTDRDVLPNMLVAGVATVTDQRTAFCIILLVRCRQINMVSTQSTTVQQTQGASAIPDSTTPTLDQGTQSLQPGNAANTSSPTFRSIVEPTPVQQTSPLPGII